MLNTPPRLTYTRRLRAAVCLAAFLCGITPTALVAASERAGKVTFAGVAVPGVTVTATQDGKTLVTTTNAEGAFTLRNLGDGVWSIRVEMIGFAPAVRDITVGSDATP